MRCRASEINAPQGSMLQESRAEHRGEERREGRGKRGEKGERRKEESSPLFLSSSTAEITLSIINFLCCTTALMAWQDALFNIITPCERGRERERESERGSREGKRAREWGL